MKRILTLILACSLVATGCDKDNTLIDQQTGPRTFVEGHTIVVTAEPVSYGRIFLVQFTTISSNYKKNINVKPGESRGTLLSVSEQPSNPKILSVEKY